MSHAKPCRLLLLTMTARLLGLYKSQVKCASRMVSLEQNVCNYLKLRKNSFLMKTTVKWETMECNTCISNRYNKPYKGVYYMNCGYKLL